MGNTNSIKTVQNKILETMIYIDQLCRENDIVYYIMGGTALGAVRHGGFIPWDDDLDIFMTPDQYKKFKEVFEQQKSEHFVLQEWGTTPKYLEYAKVRMNNTTFIEEAFKDKKDMHQGIYVDIMILHKVPCNGFIQRKVYLQSKFVTLYALSQRNWKPKTRFQAIILRSIRILPCRILVELCYRNIYRYDNMTSKYKYCYWITPAKFRSGLFDAAFFDEPEDIPFEDTQLMASRKIKKYLEYRYGNYMRLPAESQRVASVHAMIYDVDRNYTEYLE